MPTATPLPSNGGSGNSQPVATPTPSSGVPPANGGGSGEVRTPGVTVEKPTDAPTSAMRVVRQSNRPSSDTAGADRSGANDDGGGLPVGLLAFGGVVGGLIVVGGGFVVRRRLRG
jgi:hypothetical protein